MPEPLFNKVTGLSPATLFKKRLWHRCFPVNFAKFLRTPFFTEHLWWLLLKDLSGIHFRETYPWFWFLTTLTKTQFQNTLTYQNLFRLNIFAVYFQLKPIVFTVHIFSITIFFLYQTKVIFAFMKRIVDHFYHKYVIDYWFFQVENFWLVCLNLIRKPVETACY